MYFLVIFQVLLSFATKSTVRKCTFSWPQIAVNSTLMHSYSRFVVMCKGALVALDDHDELINIVDSVTLDTS